MRFWDDVSSVLKSSSWRRQGVYYRSSPSLSMRRIFHRSTTYLKICSTKLHSTSSFKKFIRKIGNATVRRSTVMHKSGELATHCTLFPLTKFLSHWVFLSKVFNETVSLAYQLSLTHIHSRGVLENKFTRVSIGLECYRLNCYGLSRSFFLLYKYMIVLSHYT